jgi:aryl-alcohol dehydrogenase-like predicted oxidoreductase
MFTGEAFKRNLAIVRRLEDFASDREMTVAELAIAWTLANPAVDVAIVGARNQEQIQQTAPAADIRLSSRELAQVEELLRDEVPVGGPAPEKM